MKQDKQENNDERSLVVCNTNDLSFLNSFVAGPPFGDVTIGGRIKGDTTDYEKMNRVIYL